ncbi:MAG: RHS repeat domain-containing protein, partial [Thiohalomonadales bacterium]
IHGVSQLDFWFLLGTYSFNAGTSGYLEITDEGIVSSSTTYIGADAARFVQVGAVASNTVIPNTNTPIRQADSFKTVSFLTSKINNDTNINNRTFTIDPKQQSTVVLVIVTDEFGKTLAPKVWYQSVKQGRWKTLETSQIANLEPDVMMVVSDTKIDLWQVNDHINGKIKSFDHQQQAFNGKAWAFSKGFQQVNHVVWTPSQPDPALRPEVTWKYEYDSKGNITTRTVDTTAQNFVYDALDRLTDDVFSNQVYGYDKNGNRVALTDNGTATSLAYDPNSNRLNTNGTTAVVLDNVGNTTSDGKHTYGYNDYNQLTSVDTNITYVYNALGQRTRKVTQSATTIYHYDLDGQLISETTETGAPIKDYVYLDNQPIAQLSDVTGQPSVAYVHTGHLKTPRKVTDASGKVIWSWDSDAFGVTVANEDPDGDGVSFELNLRFAGQYFDSESGLHYNYFRYYDPSTGRYITSDPIGLDGGLNTFGYVEGNPLNYTDFSGLTRFRCKRTLSKKPGEGTQYGRATQHRYSCVIDSNGKETCGGQTASGSLFGSPGRPTTSDEDYYDPKACDGGTDNECVESCLIEEWAKKRPNYNVFSIGGTNCQSYDNSVNNICEKRCAAK